MDFHDAMINNNLLCVNFDNIEVEPEMLEQAHLKSGITKPHPHDVLSGRGNNINMHPGNQYFRSLVRHLKNEYVMSAKGDKPVFAKFIFKRIIALDPPGRFLRKEKGDHWEDIGEKKAMDKTRQALREDADKIKKEIENGTRRVITAVRRSITSYNAPRNLIGNNSITNQATTGLPDNRSSHTTSANNDFRRSAHLLGMSNSSFGSDRSINSYNNNSTQYVNLQPINQISISNQQSMTSSILSQTQSMNSSVLSQPLTGHQSSMDMSINSTLLNSLNSTHLNQSILRNNSISSAPMNQSISTSQQYNQPVNATNQPYGSNGYYNNPSLNQSSSNSIITQVPSVTVQTQDSITMPLQAPVPIVNNAPSSVETALKTNMSAPMPSPKISSHINPVQNNLGTVKETEELCHNNAKDVHFEEQQNIKEESDGDDDLEDFPGGTTNNHCDDNEEDDEFVPISFYDLENGQPVALTESFRGTEEYKPYEPYEPRRHSLYHPDFDRRSKIERRRSSMIIANFLQKLGDITDESDEDNYDEEEDESNTKRKFNDIEKLRESLRDSLRIDEVFTHDRKKADRRKSQRASLVLRQSLLKALANPVAKEKSSSKNVEKMYLPHLSYTKIDRRRSTITERSSELLKVFGSEHKAIPRKSVKQILSDVLDPVSTDTLIESVLKSGGSLVIDDHMLKILRELGDENEEDDDGDYDLF